MNTTCDALDGEAHAQAADIMRRAIEIEEQLPRMDALLRQGRTVLVRV